MGRPSKWTPEINARLIEFFDREPVTNVEVTKRDKKGNEYTVIVEKPCFLPTFEKFAAENDLTTATICSWAKPENEEKYPGFLYAYKKSKDLQKNILIQNGLRGLYAPAAFIFTAKNITDMRDRQEVTGSDGEPLYLPGAVIDKNNLNDRVPRSTESHSEGQA